jgi:hypothetical protein
METSARDQRSRARWRESWEVENLCSGVVYYHRVHRRTGNPMRTVFQAALWWVKDILGSALARKPMKYLKAMPYIIVALISQGFVAFTTASMFVLYDIATQRAFADALINQHITLLVNYNVGVM